MESIGASVYVGFNLEDNPGTVSGFVMFSEPEKRISNKDLQSNTHIRGRLDDNEFESKD